MTSGQHFALWQLREVAAANPGCVEIENVTEPTAESTLLWVTVSIRIGAIPRVKDGLPLREREAFFIGIPSEFPLNRPSVWVGHTRFAGRPHVQWSRHLCLFQASTEWNPSDGMFGLLDRLEYWLRKGALNQLDPEGEPLHPPAVYADLSVGKYFIPKANAPVFESNSWLGFARIIDLPNHVEIIEWFDLDSLPVDGTFALALLFGSPLPWEYPKKVADLFRECERQGIAGDLMFRILRAATTFRKEGEPLYLILGSPMRGISGGPRKQHLSVWAIPAEGADSIRLTIGESGDTAELTRLRDDFERLLIQVLQDMAVSWCPVLEARPEVTVRRDEQSPLSYFRGKSVSIWGCGALGAPIAIHLCRAGVRRLTLRDNDIVTPGVLIRQPYFANDVCKNKVEALREQLLQIRSDIEVDGIKSDVETLLSNRGQDWTDGAEIIIDATASDPVRRRLDIMWNSTPVRHVPIASLMLDRTATQLITAVVTPGFSGGTWDVLRKAKVETLRDPSFRGFADSFFPAEIRDKPFQPEPGCSEPTFIGSSADSAALAAIGLNTIAGRLINLVPDAAISTLFSQPLGAFGGSTLQARFELVADFVILAGDHEVRISQSALREIRAWVTQNRRTRKSNVETGGLLWGEWDDAMNIVWVSNASGPPPDSYHSAEHFICGVQGTREEHEARLRLTRGTVGYIGMWHTHPTSSPLPSDTDFLGMHQILTRGALPPRKNLLLIFGRESHRDTVGAVLFRRISGDESAAVHDLREGRAPLPEDIL